MGDIKAQLDAKLAEIEKAKGEAFHAYIKIVDMLDCMKEFVITLIPLSSEEPRQEVRQPQASSLEVACALPKITPQPAPHVSDFCKASSEWLSTRKKTRKMRKNMEGHACEQCELFYKAADLDKRHIQKCTRHRGPKRPPTPPGYWNPGWISPVKNDKTEENDEDF